MTTTRRGSIINLNRRLQHKNGGRPNIAPKSKSKKKDAAKIMAQQLSFDPAAHDLLLVQGAHADHVLHHLGISAKSKTHHNDPLSATRAPLDSAMARVMINATIDAIHANVDRLRARGDFANAVVQLDRAFEHGSIRARVELADILYDGRIGAISSAKKNTGRARVLLDVDDDKVVRNNPDCMGLRVFLELKDGDHSARVRDDAAKSARANSKYGTFALGEYFLAMPGASARATQCFERSAYAGYDRAQDALGLILSDLDSFPPADPAEIAQLEKDRGKALKLFISAANQGFPIAMFHLGDLYRTEAERLRTTTTDDVDLRRMISDARYWYQRSNHSHDDELEELLIMEIQVWSLELDKK